MKSIPHLTGFSAIILAILLSQSCNKKDKISAPVPGPVVMTTDFQSSFENSRVQYFVDDYQVFDQALTTRKNAGLAHTHEGGLQPGIHKLRILVDGQYSKDTLVDLRSNLYLGVNYNAGEIRFLLSDQRWNYE